VNLTGLNEASSPPRRRDLRGNAEKKDPDNGKRYDNEEEERTLSASSFLCVSSAVFASRR
jgi:hypothetical protein